jgi:hypothetical protein
MADDIIRVRDGFAYRNGARRQKDMTPRPDHDVSADLQEAGLSTWRDLEAAIKPGGKGQKIDLTLLDPALLGCFQDQNGHVSIVPIDVEGNMDMMKLAEWAKTWGSEDVHPLTTMVMDAIVEKNVKRRS